MVQAAARPTIWRAWDGTVELTNIPGAAALMGVSRRTIYNWIAKGRVETRFAPSGAVRIVIDSLWRDARPDYAPTPVTTAPELAGAHA